MSKVKNPAILKKARKILQQKLELERIFEIDIKTYFKACVNAIARGSSLPSSQTLITTNANRIVNKLFEHKDRGQLKTTVIKGNAELIKTHYKSIDSTNNDNYDKALSASREELEKPETKAATTKAVINQTAANIFKQSTNNRIQNIAITETSSIHNKSRQNLLTAALPDYNTAIDDDDYDEADDIADLVDSVAMDDANDEHRKLAIALVGQTWVSLNDSSTCDICGELDGQMVPFGEPFVAFGENYYEVGDPHPGDRCDIVS